MLSLSIIVRENEGKTIKSRQEIGIMPILKHIQLCTSYTLQILVYFWLIVQLTQHKLLRVSDNKKGLKRNIDMMYLRSPYKSLSVVVQRFSLHDENVPIE